MSRASRELREVFSHFDRDKSGSIDPKEFEALLEALGGGFTKEEIRIGLEELDRNKNGKIDFAEFVRWWGER